MAKLIGNELTFLNAASTAINLTMPDHVTDDVLVIFITQDANTAITMNTAGWLPLVHADDASVTAGTGVCSAAYYIKATSSSMVANITTTDGWIAQVFCIRDVDTTTQVDAVSFTGVGTAASEFSSSSVTTGTADCFVLYCIGIDGIAVAAHSDPGVMSIGSADNQGTTSTTSACLASAWYQQRATGATPTPSWTSSLSGAYTKLTVALRNKSGGVIPAYVDDSALPGTKMIMGSHFSTLNNLTFDAALSLSNIGPSGSGKATVFDAAAATGDYGINPYSAALASTPAITAATSATGFQVTFTSTHDLSTDFIVGTVIAANPKMANYFQGSVVQGGTYIALADASNNYHSFQILARNSAPNTEGRAVFCIQPNQTATRYGYSATGPTLSATKKLLFLSNNPAGAITLYTCEIHRARTHITAGGSSSVPVDADGLTEIGKSFRVPLIQKSGATGLLSYVPLQFGGGDALNLKLTAGSLQFPRIYSTTTKELNFHAASANIGLSLAGKSGDTVYIGDGYTISSPSAAYFEIHANATSAATWYLDGLTIAGMPVTLRNVTTFTGILFTDNPTLNFNGCTIDGCTISKVPAGNDTLTTNSTTNIDNCTINTSTVTAGNRWCSVADPSIFTGNSFTGGGGHAIRITTAGTYSLVGNIFTGFGADGSTGAAILNDSGGAVTLNISGGGSTPTVKNGTSASTTVNAGAVTVLAKAVTEAGANIQSAKVHLEADTGGPFPSGATVTIANSGTTATVTHTSHSMSTNDKAAIRGASHDANIGVFSITKIDNNSYSYTMGSSPGSNPTGTITSTFVVLSGNTDANGEISMSRVFPSNQPVKGQIRKSTSVPYYKQATLTGTVSSSAGATLTGVMISDD
jgi:hypothetical protein